MLRHNERSRQYPRAREKVDSTSRERQDGACSLPPPPLPSPWPCQPGGPAASSRPREPPPPLPPTRRPRPPARRSSPGRASFPTTLALPPSPTRGSGSLAAPAEYPSPARASTSVLQCGGGRVCGKGPHTGKGGSKTGGGREGERAPQQTGGKKSARAGPSPAVRLMPNTFANGGRGDSRLAVSLKSRRQRSQGRARPHPLPCPPPSPAAMP